MKMYSSILAVSFACYISLLVNSCGLNADESVIVMQDTIAVLESEIVANKQDLVTVEDPVTRAQLELLIDAQLRQVRIFKAALADAKTAADAKWSTGEAIIGVIGGFFPPALLALPWIRTLRKQRTAIFNSIQAGGGPANPEAAKTSLMENSPPARAAFKNWKRANGLPSPAPA